MSIELPALRILKSRISENRKFIQVIAGPRQIGKTTTVQQLVSKLKTPVHSVSADDNSKHGNVWIDQQWETARFLLNENKHKESVLIIDEIQKVHNWPESIKKNWDSDTKDKLNLKVILLGSSRLLIQQGLTESLAGRFEILPMTHWDFTSMQKAFDLTPEQFVWFGGYPGAADLINNEKRWRDYVKHSLIETTISKDILMLTRIDKPALLKNLFELSCMYSGQMVSFTKMLGQLHDAGNTVTLASYLNILDEAGLITGLQKFSGSKMQSKGSIPKLQVYNTALSSVYSAMTFKEAHNNPALWGRVIESAIGAHLANATKTEDLKLFYWRERNDEVDFVLQQGKKHIAIEVKSNAKTKLPGMNAFVKNFSPHKTLLVGESGISWKQFLKMNAVDLF